MPLSLLHSFSLWFCLCLSTSFPVTHIYVFPYVSLSLSVALSSSSPLSNFLSCFLSLSLLLSLTLSYSISFSISLSLSLSHYFFSLSPSKFLYIMVTLKVCLFVDLQNNQSLPVAIQHLYCSTVKLDFCNMNNV